MTPSSHIAASPPSRATDGDASADTLERARRIDRLSTLEHLASHFAHQLGSPLNVIEGRAAMMASGRLSDADIQRNARIIGEQSARMAQVLREVMSFCRRGSRRTNSVDLVDLAHAARSILAPTARARGATISFQGAGSSARVHGNPDTLLLVLVHLLDNGIRATPERGILSVRIQTEEMPVGVQGPNGSSEPFLCIHIDDEGPGIEEQVLPRLFKPFTTTRGVRDGSGFGLFIAQAIARDHGGWIEGVNKGSGGARFTLYLPRGSANAE